jgi:hypothetical protein
MSLDGFIAGPSQTLDEPLGDGRLPDSPRALECTRVVESPTGVAHLQYRTGG